MKGKIVISVLSLICFILIFGGGGEKVGEKVRENVTVITHPEVKSKIENVPSSKKSDKRKVVISHKSKLNLKQRRNQVRRYFRKRTKHMEEVCARSDMRKNTICKFLKKHSSQYIFPSTEGS